MGLQWDIQGSVAIIFLAMIVSFSVSVIAARELTETTPKVPASIQVPRYKLQLSVHAIGHQHYRFNGSAWVNFNATAVLYNVKNKEIGIHYFLETVDALGGQPTWETLSSKGVPSSSVTAKVLSRETIDEDSVAWLLLQATQSHGSTKYFGDVDLVQRFNTEGGLAPTSITGASTGDVKKSPYSADYAYYILSTGF